MSLLSIQLVSKAFGADRLFEEISFTIVEGDRMGLFGPNGSGKSTLLKILAGIEVADSGSISKRGGLKVGYCSQSPEFGDITVEEVLLQEDPDNDTRARILLGKGQFEDFSKKASELSGGWKKRLDIVRSLMNEPDLLLLDEPTNHLDLEGIAWLENFLKREVRSFFVISHDRVFLEKLTNRVMELNRCYPEGVLIANGNMSQFFEQKETYLQGQEEKRRGLASTLRKEVDWLKRSPKARTTKSISRVNKTYDLLDEFADVKKRLKVNKVELGFVASDRDTKNLIVTKNLTKQLGGKALFKGLDIVLSPGARLGIVGKNGAGKTTLLKILAGEIEPDMGSIKRAQDLKLVYFDQHREQLPLDCSLKEALSPRGDMVEYHGQFIHVNGWAKRFLFDPDRLMLPIKCLSGGERARILIARLMLKPADVLFLDEPTNDLDIPTLEVMEESLLEFPGAVVLISHDRFLMDRVCTQILCLDDRLEERFFADYSQCEKALNQLNSKKQPLTKEAAPIKPPPGKLSYNEKKELEEMERKIHQAEAKVETRQKEMEEGNNRIDLCLTLGEAQKELETLYERWQFLENKLKGL